MQKEKYSFPYKKNSIPFHARTEGVLLVSISMQKEEEYLPKYLLFYKTRN